MTDKQLDDKSLEIVLERLMSFNEKEQKYRKNKFIIISVALVLGFSIYMGVIYNIFNPSSQRVVGDDGEGHVSLVRISGEISASSTASAQMVNPALNKAFKDEESKGVVLLINSPGGSPVQSSLIYKKIIKLSEEYDKRVIAVSEDMVTSGAYFIASAADKIYVNESSLTGSIGVIMQNFGLDQIIQKVGVSHRVFTAGENKNRFDNYQPLSESDVIKAKELLSNMHKHFIAAVMAKRADRFTRPPEEVFTGDFWTGEQALEMGLVDNIGDVSSAIEDEFGVAGYIDYTARSPLRNLMETIKSYVSPLVTYSAPVIRF